MLELTTKMKEIVGVKRIDVVTGPYDVISYVEAEDLKTMGEMIVKKIQATSFVARTLTCVTVEEIK